ncbi:molybdopterin converting factor subunit 1 [Limibacter armeniacum]|uniref:molybdopterin converting factor subunit 1 n=1 Tax=Limibacter armeniacum TaxID=466084 RepID=UPI002FE5B1E0
MNIQLLLFGIAREIVGEQQLEVSVSEEGVTVGKLKEDLYQKYPELEALTSLALAVNQSYAEDDQLIKDRDEVALIPPVSGG